MVSNLAHMFNNNLNDDEAALIDDITLLRVQYLKKNNKLNVVLKSCYELDEKTKKIIKKIISKKLNGFDDIDLICYRDVSNATLEQIANEFWTDIVGVVSQNIPVCKECMIKSKKEVNDEILKLRYGNEFVCRLLKDKNIEKILKNSIEDMFGVKCRVELKYDSSITESDYIVKRDKEQKEIIKKVKEQMQNSAASKKSDSQVKTTKQENNKGQGKRFNYQKDNGPKDKNCIMGRSINHDIVDIREVDETSGIVAIEGDIFNLDIKETKTGKKIILFNITDYTSSITVKCFPRPKDMETVLEEVKKGLHCKVRGEAMMDTFSKEVVIMGRDIVKLEKIEKMDTADEKRVELHLHTQMSAMDAITSASDLIERAAKWGHSAIAITDHGVAQAYPEAMSAAKKHNIKVIYGIEAYLVDDGVPIVINADNRSIDDEFVVFDIETTGFSSTNDKIIEIGAVKIKNGEIIDRFNEFVNPGIKIPYKITELTGITNGMVSNAEKIDAILPRFMEFSKETVLVAHNASFDMSFIKKNCDDLGLKFNNPVMDTIPLCKFLYTDLKRYKLNTVAKYLGISLENHHRAVDDAKATGEILLCCFLELKEREINSLDKLNEEFLGNFDVKKAPAYHLIILAKNQTGLKNIYKLISTSNLEYFHRRPRMPKSLIEQHREGLIIGSACEAGQIYKEVLKGKKYEEIKEIVDFYDYLEIQPIGNNEFMIRKGEVKDEEELKDINRRICELGEEINKPVVATCDVHFMDPHEEMYRRILMNFKGFSDADNQPPLYFRTTNEMLKEFEYLGEEKAKEVVVYNTQKIADMIEAAKPIPDETYPPVFETAEEDLKNMCWNKARSIYSDNIPEVVEKRLKRELDSIIGNGYATLYVIAHKLVAKSYEDGYLVGSRGSVGSSFAATMADITEVNGLPPHYVCPNCKKSEFILDGSVGAGVDMEDKDCPECGTKYYKDGFDIPFETFLGFEGDKEPDIDLNFSGDNQGDIHKYTEVLFGKGKTFKAGTIGTVADKTAFGYAKKYLEERNIIVPKAELERLSMGCTGVKRTSGQHPGGIMVVPADNEIFNFCPIQHPADDPNSDIITTHFDYHSISGRLLKLDILGHDDPTVLRMLKDLTGLNPQTLPLGDSKVLSLFTNPEGLGITAEELGCEVGSFGLPEFGTKFVRQMLVDTQPKTFSDLVRISGLSHGTDVWINNAQYFIAEGYTTLKDCISTRDDIMVYLIYKGLEPKTAFTIMEKVRKGKGLTEEHENIMKEHDVPSWYIESCKRIKYMFPKGHAAAYVMMAIRIAYFKVYYPEAYYSAYFTVRADEFDGALISKGDDAVTTKMEELYAQGNAISVKDKGLLTTLEICHEMFLRGIKLLDVDLYESEAVKFKIEENGIRMPLNALNGVADNAAKSIVDVRGDGEFISKQDLRNRAKVTKTVIETLDDYGCLEGLSETNQLSFF